LPIESALGFLRAVNQGRAAAPITIIYGPHAFLREYALDTWRNSLAVDGFKYRALHIGSSDSYSILVNELEEGDLFAAKRLVVARVLRSYRDRAGDDDSDNDDHAVSGNSDESALIRVFPRLGSAVRLALVYERDKPPAKIRRAVEQTGALVNCMRPFENQIRQYAEIFAKDLSIKITMREADLLVARYAGDLAAIANTLNKAVITRRENETIDLTESAGNSAVRIPELFEIAESLVQRNVAETLALFSRAMEIGRDPIEVLAMELIPQLRRMLLAAALLAQKKEPSTISTTMGLAPTSLLATRAIEGARRFGLKRLQTTYHRACELDESFKAGIIKQREPAVTALILELVGTQ
jgi:DNA polymerase III delta subunit